MPALRALPLKSVFRSLWAVALLLATLTSPALAQPAGWTPLGGPEAGTVTELAPAAGGRVWATTETAGLFRSDDGAAHWIRIERGPVTGHQESGLDLDPSWVRGEIQAIAASPTDPDIAYAAIRPTVLRTEDGGATWEPTGLSGDIEVIAISPSDPDVVYLSNRRQVWRTDDGGDTWRQADRGLAGDVGYIYSLTVDPHDPLTVYVAAGSGSYRSTDGGRSWVQGQGLSFVELVRIAVDPDNPAVLYGAERFDNVWKSVDQGLTWTRLAAFDNSPHFTDLEFDPFSPGTLYLTANGGAPGGNGPTGRVLRSLDRGVTWTVVLTTELIYDLDFDPQRPGRLYLATDVLGVFKSEDSGSTWAPANEGLTAALVVRLTPDPHTQGTLYAVVSSFRQETFDPGSLGIWKSTDGGVNWTPVNTGLEGLGGGSGRLPVVREVVADPRRPGVLYAVTAAGLFKSTNGGASWQRTDVGSPLQPAWDLAIDPRNSDVLYAVANEGTTTAAKSLDGGQTWTPLSGPTGPLQVAEVDLWNPSTVYLAGNGFWRSEDDGATWTQVPSSPSGWTRLVTGPAPGFLYGLAFFSLVGSADRGDSWLRIQLPVDNPSQSSIFDLWRGPATASPVYAATNSGVFLLTANNAWLQLGGDLWAFSVAADAFQGDRVYAGTRDGLVLGFGRSAGSECADSTVALCLEDRFLVEVTWELPGGSQTAARARPVSGASGSFWFFDPDLAEVVVKVVDGRPLNQHFWFFANGMTSFTYTVRVTDTMTGDSQLYGSPGGQFLSIVDTRAFLEPGPPPPGSVGLPSLGLPTHKAGSILLASRFRAELSWSLGGRSGTAEALPLGANSAGFWIFAADHLEAAVKVFDGRAINGNYWVFFTNLTSAGLTLTVTDTETGQRKVYSKPPGLVPGQVDPEAF